MKKNNATKVCLFLVGLLGVTIIVSIALAQTQKTQPQTETQNERLIIRDALRRGGLREAAKIKRFYVQEIDIELMEYGGSTLDSLANGSSLVVLGTPKRNRCRLSSDGLSINNEYEFSVQSVLKGNVSQEAKIQVMLPGCRWTFEDGGIAEQRIVGFKKMINNQTYLLFLKERPAEDGIYRTVGGPGGIFEINESGVKPYDKRSYSEVSLYEGDSQIAFLERVRGAIIRHQAP